MVLLSHSLTLALSHLMDRNSDTASVARYERRNPDRNGRGFVDPKVKLDQCVTRSGAESRETPERSNARMK